MSPTDRSTHSQQRKLGRSLKNGKNKDQGKKKQQNKSFDIFEKSYLSNTLKFALQLKYSKAFHL